MEIFSNKGLLQTVFSFQEGVPLREWRDGTKAAALGHLDVLKHGNVRITKRSVDKAAESGRLEVVKWLYENGYKSPEAFFHACMHDRSEIARWLFDNGHMAVVTPFDVGAAAKIGDLELVQALLDKNSTRDDIVVAYAAIGGRIDVIKWLLEQGFRYDPTAMEEAASEGHTELVRWLCENNFPGTAHALDRAMRADDLESIKLLFTHRPWERAMGEHVPDYVAQRHAQPPRSDLMPSAAYKGRLEIVKWLFDNGGQCPRTSLERACEEAHWEVADFLLDKSVVPTEECFYATAQYGNRALLDRMLEASPGVHHRMLNGAAYGGHLDLLEWAWSLGCRDRYLMYCSDQNIADSSCDCRHPDQTKVLDWLLAHGFAFTSQAYGEAISAERVDILEWLHAHGVDPFTESHARSWLMKRAAEIGNVEVMQWLHDHGAVSTEEDGVLARVVDRIDQDRFQSESTSNHPKRKKKRHPTIETVRWLLEHGYTRDDEITKGWTALDQVRDPDVAKLLLEHDLKFSPQSLANAIRNNIPDLVELFLERGAPLSLDALDSAARIRDPDLALVTRLNALGCGYLADTPENSSEEIADFLRAHGCVRVHDPAHPWAEYDWYKPTTPFNEADLLAF